MADMVDTSKPEQEAGKPMAVQDKSEPDVVVVDSDSDAEVEPQGTVAQLSQAKSPKKEIPNSEAETDGSVSGKEGEK